MSKVSQQKYRQKKKRLRAECNKLWYETALKKYGGKCEIPDCLTPNYDVVAHHYYYKSSYGHLKYDLDNAVLLCRRHHFLLHHQDPKKIEDKIIQARGKKWLAGLKKKKDNPKHYQNNLAYYEEILQDLSNL